MIKRIIRFTHLFFSDRCVSVLMNQSRAMNNWPGYIGYKTPWWFNMCSKIEFKLRYMYKTNKAG